MRFDMSVETFLTVLYYVVEELYQKNAPTLPATMKVGPKPEFSDSEILTLRIAQYWYVFRKNPSGCALSIITISRKNFTSQKGTFKPIFACGKRK